MAAGAAALAACSSQKPGEVAKDGSVTVKHVFGETKIPKPPTRVVSAGLTEQDDLLALGIVPVAVTDWFGAEPFGVWPWAQAKLGGAQPVVLSLADGIQVDQISSLRPDLIVATNAGLDQDTYSKLSEIAPTIAQSGQDAFFEPWKDQADTIGQAVFKHDDMAALVAGVEDKFKSVGREQPAIHRQERPAAGRPPGKGQRAGLHAALAHRFPHPDGIHDPRHRRRVDPARQDGRGPRCGRRADLGHGERRGTGRAACRSVVGQAEDPHTCFTGKDLAGAIAFASPLSYPLVADQLPAGIAKVLGLTKYPR